MTVLEEIEQQLRQLPPDKQSEVLDFVRFLQERRAVTGDAKSHTLRQHPAFGSWRERRIDALRYEQDLRAEWDGEH